MAAPARGSATKAGAQYGVKRRATVRYASGSREPTRRRVAISDSRPCRRWHGNVWRAPYDSIAAIIAWCACRGRRDCQSRSRFSKLTAPFRHRLARARASRYEGQSRFAGDGKASRCQRRRIAPPDTMDELAKLAKLAKLLAQWVDPSCSTEARGPRGGSAEADAEVPVRF